MAAFSLTLMLLMASSALGCERDDDCELNGVCTGGKCVCDAQWFGPSCGQLHLLPTTRNSGFQGGGSGTLNSSTWGGSVYGPDENQTWHMLISHFTGNCGLSSWKTNSEVVHSVSETPLGPYHASKVVVGRFAHNPSLHRAPNGTFFLYHIGCGGNSTKPVTGCTNGSTPNPPSGGDTNTDTDTSVLSCDGPHYMTGASSPSLDSGLWHPLPEITLSSPNKTLHWLTNPCLFPMSNDSTNHTLLWLYRQSGGAWPGDPGSSERIGVATSKGYSDSTLVDLSPDAPLFNFPLEDQFLWRDKRGFFHALTHKDRPDAKGDKTGVAGHLFSRDGIHDWQIGANSPYNTTLTFEDGSVIELGKRARPQLLVKDGVPQLLTTGAGLPNRGDFSFTTVQPIAQN